MKTHRVTSNGTPLDFDAAIWHASAIADDLFGENMLLHRQGREGCPAKGFRDCALNRGGAPAANFDEGRFAFCFRPLGNFTRQY